MIPVIAVHFHRRKFRVHKTIIIIQSLAELILKHCFLLQLQEEIPQL